jgi:aminodeoxyfutalosine synthase
MAMAIDALAGKIEAGERLSDADVALLESERDIIALGMLADAVRRRLRGSAVTFVRVFDLKVMPGPEGLALRATSGPGHRSGSGPADIPPATGEVRLFDTPETLDEAITVATCARDLTGNLPLSAFCLFELSKLKEGLPVVLPALKKTGLEAIAQAPIDRLRSPEHALEAVSDAGLRIARLTIDETPVRPWTAVCREVAAHQRRLLSIPLFAPLARRIDETQPTTGYADVKRVALARVLIQNVESIQVDWALYGPKLAQVALTFGADDIDSVDPFDDESQGRRRSPLEEIRRSIQAASFTPVERDGRFHTR